MAISYPLTPPTNVAPLRVELRQSVSIGVSASPFSFNSQRQDFNGGYWVLGVTLPMMTRATAEPWIAFLASLRGPLGTFLMGDPLGKVPLGDAGGAPAVNGASQVGSSLVTDGWTINEETLKAGDYLSLNQRLYKNLSDVTADGSGNATFDIWPPLRESPSDDLSITINGTTGLFRLSNTRQSLGSQSGHVDAPNYSIAFDAVEAV